MEEGKFVFKNTGDEIYNDVVYPGRSFNFDISSDFNFEIQPSPETKFWRFGIRLSRESEIEFFHPASRYPKPLFDKYKDIHLSAGDWIKELDGNSNIWAHENRLYLAQYNLNDKHVLYDFPDYKAGATINWNLKYREGHLLYIAITYGSVNFEGVYEIGTEIKYLKLFAWADKIDFEIFCNIKAGVTVIPETLKVNTILRESVRPYVITNNVDGVIGVNDQASVIYEMLNNLRPETGMMVGIFGRWGRGKTFFWEAIKKLNTDDKFIPLEFNAWKYQDTPASWAYLYETIVQRFLEEEDYWIKIKKVRVLNKKVFKLNKRKYGLRPLAFFIIALLTTVMWYFLVSSEYKLNVLLRLLGGVSFGGIIGVCILWFKHLPNAKEIFKHYNSISRYKNLLGIQSEIQEELKLLLNIWFEELGDKRLLLFVDDIDRCSEDRMIQTIDALRILLEDSQISKNIVVLAAVDGNVLKRAIKSKYWDSIKDENPTKDSILSVLSREYLDKLFISGIKLAELGKTERHEIFENYTKDKIRYSAKPKPGDTFGEESNMAGASTFIMHTSGSPIDTSQSSEKFEIEEFEFQMLKSLLVYFEDITPREIRIYYYRYLLARKLLHLFDSDTIELWHNLDVKKEILPLLIIKYSKSSTLEAIQKDQNSLLLNSSTKTKLQLFNRDFEIESRLLKQLFVVTEMVVVY